MWVTVGWKSSHPRSKTAPRRCQWWRSSTARGTSTCLTYRTCPAHSPFQRLFASHPLLRLRKGPFRQAIGQKSKLQTQALAQYANSFLVTETYDLFYCESLFLFSGSKLPALSSVGSLPPGIDADHAWLCCAGTGGTWYTIGNCGKGVPECGCMPKWEREGMLVGEERRRIGPVPMVGKEVV